jgi:hypothetical protein
VSLLEPGVLPRNMQVSQAPLQRWVLVHRAASRQGETDVGDAHACRGRPHCGLATLGQQGLAHARPGNRVMPVTRDLSLEERTRSPQIRDHAAELELEYLGI